MGTQIGVARITWLTILALVPLLYISTCSVICCKRSKDFERVGVGNTEQQVVAALGTPSVLEKSSGASFSRYGAQACAAPCAERFWFENRLTLDSEAWSVELDAGGKVIKKSHWVSP
jgi:hypothetical protein